MVIIKELYSKNNTKWLRKISKLPNYYFMIVPAINPIHIAPKVQMSYPEAMR
jgi:hypothetical protein